MDYSYITNFNKKSGVTLLPLITENKEDEEKFNYTEMMKLFAFKILTDINQDVRYKDDTKIEQYTLSEKIYKESIGTGDLNKDNYFVMVLKLIVSHKNCITKFKANVYLGYKYHDDESDNVNGHHKYYNYITNRICYANAVKCNIVHIAPIIEIKENMNWKTNKSAMTYLNMIFKPENIKKWLELKVCIYCNDIYRDVLMTRGVCICWKCKINEEVIKGNRPILNKCCICIENVTYMNKTSICMDERHSIHKECYNRLKLRNAGREITCPMCRQNYTDV